MCVFFKNISGPGGDTRNHNKRSAFVFRITHNVTLSTFIRPISLWLTVQWGSDQWLGSYWSSIICLTHNIRVLIELVSIVAQCGADSNEHSSTINTYCSRVGPWDPSRWHLLSPAAHTHIFVKHFKCRWASHQTEMTKRGDGGKEGEFFIRLHIRLQRCSLIPWEARKWEGERSGSLAAYWWICIYPWLTQICFCQTFYSKCVCVCCTDSVLFLTLKLDTTPLTLFIYPIHITNVSE